MNKSTLCERNLAILFALLIPFGTSLACDALPADAIVPVEELINRSEKIVLVTVDAAGATPDGKRQRQTTTIDLDAERRRATEDRPRTDDRAFASLSLATMTAVEYLKGSGPARLSRPVTTTASEESRFDNHRDPGFWNDPAVGHVRVDANCRPLIGFAEGGTYLLFIGPWHVKGAERIESDADAWLAYVREQLAN